MFKYSTLKRLGSIKIGMRVMIFSLIESSFSGLFVSKLTLEIS